MRVAHGSGSSALQGASGFRNWGSAELWVSQEHFETPQAAVSRWPSSLWGLQCRQV